MNADIVKGLLANNKVSVGELMAGKKATSYMFYQTAEELSRLGIASFDKGTITLMDSPLANAFKKLAFQGFKTEILSKKNIDLLLTIIEPKPIEEIAKETRQSQVQAARQLKGLVPFVTKNGKQFALSKSNALLYDFLTQAHKKFAGSHYWHKGGETLLKLPTGHKFEGVLTGFSRFTEFGLMIFPTHQFVHQPKKELKLEEILAHAIKFSENANDLMLCILFYLKNKAKLDVHEIEKECEKLDAISLWLDIITFLEDQPVKNKKMFLPRNEFMEKASVYKVGIQKRHGAELIQKIFEDAEKSLKGKIRVYFIGGNALIEHKAKTSTKDIDVIAESKKEAEDLTKAFEKNGFNAMKGRDLQYEQLNVSSMLEKEGFPRIDLFVGKICGALEFSERMRKRSKKIKEGKLEIYLASMEDVFLLKSVSSRDSDLVDCENILMTGVKLDWNAIISEILAQQNNLQGHEFIILDHLETLEKRFAIKLPITKKVLSLCLEKGILVMAKNPSTIHDFSQKLDFPESALRNTVQKLVKQRKLVKLKGKPFKVKIK